VPQVRYTTEQVIHKLREIEVVVAQGISIEQAVVSAALRTRPITNGEKNMVV
jgi:hypothetical protein